MNEWNKWTNGNVISIIIILLFIYLVKQVIVYKGSEIYTDVDHPHSSSFPFDLRF